MNTLITGDEGSTDLEASSPPGISVPEGATQLAEGEMPSITTSSYEFYAL